MGLELIQYFVYGFILDILIVLYYYVLNSKSPIKAFFVTLILTFYQNLYLLDVLENKILLTAFSIGCASAVYLMVYLRSNGILKI